MKDTITVFLFVGSNHLSNVKSLQSIYKQDYEHIRLIVCNDCTYGFESERLLGNFEHRRPKNIEHIIFQENRVSIGKYRSLQKFLPQIQSEYFMILHAGEYFISPSSVREAIRVLKKNKKSDAVICACEFWDDKFKLIYKVYSPKNVMDALCHKGDEGQGAYKLYDCMVVYRTSVLVDENFVVEEACLQISSRIIPCLLEKEIRIEISEKSLCRYSESSKVDMVNPTPKTLNRRHVDNVISLVQNQGTWEAVQDAEVTVGS